MPFLKMISRVGVLAVLMLISACASNPAICPLSDCATWQKHDLVSDDFTLVSYAPPPNPASTVNTLVVYLEGDGYAFDRWGPTNNPTPKNQLTLKLALSDPWPKKAYLARPCQYQTAQQLKNCDYSYWSHSRYAPEAIKAMSEALDGLKARFNANRLSLVGYSGGGVMAAFLAARRSDIDSIVTIGAPLDLDGWTDHHDVAPLVGSLRPMDVAADTRAVCQLHLVGQKDDRVPLSVVEPFIITAVTDDKMAVQRVRFRVIEDASHAEGWQGFWPQFLQQYRPHDRATICPL
jgi:pimeloyl-ACP methyl ester carboxylesterase